MSLVKGQVSRWKKMDSPIYPYILFYDTSRKRDTKSSDSGPIAVLVISSTLPCAFVRFKIAEYTLANSGEISSSY